MRHLRADKEGDINIGHIVVALVMILVMILIVMALIGPINAAIHGHSWDGNGTACDPDVYTQESCRETLDGTTLALALFIPLFIIVAVILIILRELGIIGG